MRLEETLTFKEGAVLRLAVVEGMAGLVLARVTAETVVFSVVAVRGMILSDAVPWKAVCLGYKLEVLVRLP